MRLMLCISFMIAAATGYSHAQDEDPFLWLEDVDSEKALEWVEKKNRFSLDILKSHPEYENMYSKSLEILNSGDRIASPSIVGDHIYNFWQDAEHVRGIWRRTSKESYLSGDPEWEILIDIDAMSEKDGIDWVYKGARGLYPDYTRFMVSLSKGGGDAVVIREFDTGSKSFIEDGFYLPESKGGVSWLDKNTLLVASDFGEGSMTTSGYPRQVRLWERGASPGQATVIFEGETDDVSSGGYVINKSDKQYTVLRRGITFYTSSYHIYKDGKVIHLKIPDDANMVNILEDQVIIDLKSDWEVDGMIFSQGSLVSASYPDLLEGIHKISLIIEPDEKSSVRSVSASKSMLIISMLSNVSSELYSYKWQNGEWKGTKVDAPDYGSIGVGSVSDFGDDYFFWYQNFLTPSSLYYANARDNNIQLLQSLPAFFKSEGLKVWQYEAVSADGTTIPYFVIGPEDIEYNGKNPTLLYSYGGFEVSMLPSYSPVTGKLWLEKGGVYVLANIRGGGEFGPKWHQAGLKENRQKVFDDFHAVAEELIDRRITSGRHLGIQGGSNGGLLVGVAFTQRPELYHAVVCQVPLLDMKRYNKLLAGASWMGEYGNPDIPEEWEFIKQYSPYHNLKEGLDYPEVFFTTSTRDDRVHPGHARKMVAIMEDMGYNVYYFENTEGGHAGASTNEQRAMTSALGFTYLMMKLGN
ncbi:MAG: prolyl oligopeptidase family serine peptidase [Bacteroidales bacterium]